MSNAQKCNCERHSCYEEQLKCQLSGKCSKYDDNQENIGYCVWCKCKSSDPHKPCCAPDGDGHLFRY